MKIVHNWNGDALWGVVPYIHQSLQKFNNNESDTILMNGAEWIYDHSIKQQYKDYKRKCLLALWSPCEFTGQINYYHFDHYDFFTDVYCICPFTCNFMNNYFGYSKFHYIPYPFTNYSVDKFGYYDADCCWIGSIHGQDHIQAIEIISQFNYKFITSQRNTWMRHPYEFNKCTHIFLSPHDKLIELSKCKSSLHFNMIYMSPSSQKNNFKAFEHFDQGIMPQFKVRTHEAASSQSLLLVKKDPWNLIEDFYEPDIDFIYFNTFDELYQLIIDVKNNFNKKYIPIINNAYQKYQNYTVEKIFQYIKTQNPSLITWRNKHNV